MNISYLRSISDNDIKQIIELQKRNLPSYISKNEKEKEGFVTVRHDFNILKKMNNHQAHFIAKDNDTIVGYALSMTKEFKDDIEVLKPMFSIIDKNIDKSNSYIIMGQICIDKAYRKQGVFRGLYQTMKNNLKEKYSFLITEVDSNNIRSLQAHQSVGFKTLAIYPSNDIQWHVISWNWE